MTKRSGLLVCAAVLAAGNLFGQADKPKEAEAAKQGRYYRLDFTIREVEEGKVVNSRAYSALFSTAPTSNAASIRTGNRLPVPTGGQGNQFQYMDVGVNIDCRPAGTQEIAQNQLALIISAEISSVAPTDGTPPGAPPMLRTNRWNSNIIIPVRKPTVIFSSDDLTTRRKMQLEVTATPLE